MLAADGQPFGHWDLASLAVRDAVHLDQTVETSAHHAEHTARCAADNTTAQDIDPCSGQRSGDGIAGLGRDGLAVKGELHGFARVLNAPGGQLARVIAAKAAAE